MAVITSTSSNSQMPHTSTTQPGGDRLVGLTAKELRAKVAAEQEAQRKKDQRAAVDAIIKEQMQKAKETPGAQSSRLRIDLDTGEVSGVEISRGVRSGVKQRQYTTEYTDPRLEQQFGSQRVGDILRKDQARKDAELGKTRNLSEFGDVLQKQTVRKTIDNASAKEFMKAYADAQLGNIRRSKEMEGQADFSIAEPKKGSVVEQTMPSGEIISYGFEKPKLQTQYFVNLQDRLSGGPYAYERSPGENVVKGLEIPKPSGNPIEDARKGLEDYGKDLASIATGQPAYSVESDFFQSFRGGSGPKGGFVLFTPENVKALEGVGQSITANPAFAAGSLAGSAALFVGTASAASVAKIASKGVQAARAGRIAESQGKGIAEIIAKTSGIKINPAVVSVQPVKQTRAGEITLKKIIGGWLETKQFNVSIPKIDVVGEAARLQTGWKGFSLKVPSTPDAFNIMVDQQIVGKIPVKGLTKAFSEPLTTKQAQKLVGEQFAFDKELGTIIKPIETGLPKAETYTQFFAKETTGLREGTAPRFIDPLKGVPISRRGTRGLADDILKGYVVPTERTGGKTPLGDIMKTSGDVVKAQAPKRTIDVLEFSQKELAAYGKNVAKRDKQIIDAAKALGEMPSTKSGKPFTFNAPKAAKQGKTSKTPLENVAAFDFDVGLQEVSKALSGAAKSSDVNKFLKAAGLATFSSAGLKEAFGQEGPLGLGGVTGEEKVQRKKRKGDVEYSIGMVPIPRLDRETEKFIKDMNKGVVFTDERDALDKGLQFRGGSGTRDAKALKELQREITKVTGGLESKSLSKELQDLGFGFSTETSQATKTQTAQAEQLAQALGQQFGQVTSLRNNIPSPTRTIPIGGFIPGFEDEPRRKRKKSKGRKVKRGERKLKPRDVLEVAVGKEYAKAFNKAFGLKGDPYGAF